MNLKSNLRNSTSFRILLLTIANLCVAIMVYFSANSVQSTDYGDSSNRLVMDHASRKGQQVWQQKNCIACHSLYGLGGHLGPDLTQVIKRKGAAFTQAYILAGGYKMPEQDLDKQELKVLISYLTFLNNSGTYPIKNFPEHAYGKYSTDLSSSE